MEPITLEEARRTGLIDKLCRWLDKERNPLGAYKMEARLANCLTNACIESVVQVVVLSEPTVFKIKNLGRKSLGQLQELLRGDGLALDMAFASDLIAYMNAWLAEQGLPPLDSWGTWTYRSQPYVGYKPPPEAPANPLPITSIPNLLGDLDRARRLLMARPANPEEAAIIADALVALPKVERAIRLLGNPVPDSPS